MIWAIDQDDYEHSLLKTIAYNSFCDRRRHRNGAGIYKCPPIDEIRWWTWAEDQNKAGMCGRSAPLYNGFYPVCNPDDYNYACCGSAGYCGSGPDYCSCPTCVNYGNYPQYILKEPTKPKGPVKWHTSDAPTGSRGRCGHTAPKLANGNYAICNPDDKASHCCSNGGYCGSTDAHCKCDGCIDFTKTPNYMYREITWWTTTENMGRFKIL